jgi:hypothetical protein
MSSDSMLRGGIGTGNSPVGYVIPSGRTGLVYHFPTGTSPANGFVLFIESYDYLVETTAASVTHSSVG